MVILDVSDGSCSDTASKTYHQISTPCSINSSFTNSSTGFTATFTNTTSGTSASSTYFWRFGDGNTSTLQNPTHTYTSAGTYNVGLEVTDTIGGGCFDSTYNTVSIAGCPLSVYFRDSTIGINSSQFYSVVSGSSGTVFYQWNFGDGNTSTLANPSHTYSSAGPYMVSLVVSDTNCTDSTAYTIGCNISLNSFYSSTGLTASFTSTSTGITSAATYLWDFGDGNTSTSQNPVHTYASAGTYYASLSVFDSL